MPRPDWAPELARIPTSAGVYRWLDESGQSLYVGKAKNLRARLASYYERPPERTQLMMARARELVWTVVASETDALVLERAWINSFDPPWNIKLRHSGQGARILLTGGAVPRAVIAHRVREEGTRAQAFGPWPGESAAEILEAVREATGVATCSKRVLDAARASQRPCLLADLGKCVAPCVNAAGYDTVVAEAARILGGNAARAEQIELAAMATSAEAMEYEQAARHRDRAQALASLAKRQRIIGDEAWEFDVIAVSEAAEIGWSIVSVRDGVIASVDAGVCVNSGIDPEADALTDAVLTVAAGRAGMYSTHPARGLRAVPKSGSSAKSLALRAAAEIATANAQEAARQAAWRVRADPGRRANAASELAQALELEGAPWRVEALDIAHMHGTHARAGLGVLEDGQARLGRAWVVPDELAGDDYASIGWAVARRCTAKSLPAPDLLVIDGGAEQLARAVSVRDSFGKDWPIVSLAKRMEEVFVPEEEEPLILARGSGALHLLQAVRDEAHKACNSATRRAHAKAGTVSGFDSVAGIGAKRRQALQEAFGTLERAGQAGVDAVTQVDGIGQATAERIVAAAKASTQS